MYVEVDGPAANALKETAKVNIPVIQVILEGGIGHHTVPLFIAELTVQGDVLFVLLLGFCLKSHELVCTYVHFLLEFVKNDF